MGKTRKTKKIGTLKKMISKSDTRVKKENQQLNNKQKLALEKADTENKLKNKVVEQQHSSLFFQYNENLQPPYRVLMDTNFINSSLQNKVDIFKGMMDLLLAKCIPYVSDCVLAELEKMGSKYRMALQLARDPRFERLTCNHRGTYADDCICQRITEHRCFVVATNDKDLKRRIRKIPGVPIMFCKRGQFGVERMPDQLDCVPAGK